MKMVNNNLTLSSLSSEVNSSIIELDISIRVSANKINRMANSPDETACSDISFYNVYNGICFSLQGLKH